MRTLLFHCPVYFKTRYTPLSPLQNACTPRLRVCAECDHSPVSLALSLACQLLQSHTERV